MRGKRLTCGVCKEAKWLPAPPSCRRCDAPHLLAGELDFSRCPACGGADFYRQKDFNQVLGYGVIIVGAILVPYTYGLSLLVLGLVDLLLYHRVADLIVCYRCGSLYRGFKVDRVAIEPFDHFRRFKIHQEQ